jgi:hypothetical protein
VNISFREVQLVWDELMPFADGRALQAAQRLKLGSDAKALRRLVDGNSEDVRLVAALVRTGLERDYDAVLARAA